MIPRSLNRIKYSKSNVQDSGINEQKFARQLYMEVLDSGFQVLDPGFFVGGTRFRILSLATEADMYSGLQSPGFQILRPKIFGFLIPRSELPYVWRQWDEATLEAECSLRLELTCYFIIISFFLNCMLYVNVVILSSIKRYKIKYKNKNKNK